jgi:hypothetical protein
MAVVCCHGRRLLPWPSFVAMAVVCCHGRIRSVCAMIFISATASFCHGLAVADADDTTTLLLWPSRRCVGRFMAQMTADGRDGTVDCRRHGAHFGHAVAKSDLQGEIQ